MLPCAPFTLPWLQFWLLYKREKYDAWVVTWLVATGGERLMHNLPYAHALLSGGTVLADLIQDDPFGEEQGSCQPFGLPAQH